MSQVGTTTLKLNEWYGLFRIGTNTPILIGIVRLTIWIASEYYMIKIVSIISYILKLTKQKGRLSPTVTGWLAN